MKPRYLLVLLLAVAVAGWLFFLLPAGDGDPYSSPQMTRDLAGLLRDSGAAVEVSLEPGGHQLGQGDFDGAATWVAGLTAEDGPAG